MNPSEGSQQTISEAAARTANSQARVAYLDAACAGGPGSRGPVGNLVAADQPADDFLAGDPSGLLEAGRRTLQVDPLGEGGWPHKCCRQEAHADDPREAFLEGLSSRAECGSEMEPNLAGFSQRKRKE
jgi:hypothetical protein